MKRFLLIVLLSLLAGNARADVLYVRNQSEFKSLRDRVLDAASAGASEVRVVFAGGATYSFSNNMLNLSGQRYPHTRLVFLGNGAAIVGEGFAEETWSPVYQATKSISKSNRKKGEYMINAKELTGKEKISHILVTEWFQSKVYEVTAVKNGVVYFKADSGDELNMEEKYSGKHPRFKLLSSSGLKTGAGRLVSTYDAAFASISFEGFRFIGNDNVGDCLLDFTNLTTGGVVIRNCEFSSIRSDVVRVSNVSGFAFESNRVHDCYRNGVVADNRCPDVRVVDNRFENCGLGMDMSSCVDCCGTNYYIAYNQFRNFGARAVSAGVYFTADKTQRSSGVIERNTMYYDGTWLSSPQEHTVMDTGAIYLTTFSDDAVIRFNRIYDYTGMKDNRGIFCDDGASGFSIYGNVVTGIRNSYAIDARRTPEVEAAAGGKKVNTNNYVGGNVLEGALRFEGREGGSNCTKEKDFFVNTPGSVPGERRVSGVGEKEKDVNVEVQGIRDGLIYVQKPSKKALKKWKYYRKMKGCFVKQ